MIISTSNAGIGHVGNKEENERGIILEILLKE
jgi:hypothetical protein